MSFITQGKTNFRYILIVVILAVIAGGGILGYSQWWIGKQEKKLTEFPEIKIPKKAEDETANWKDKVKACITELSFLEPILDELEKYETNANNKSIEAKSEVTETSRGCITLPEDLYSRLQREFIEEGDAALGYVSNWEEACGGIHVGPIIDNCTGDGYQATGDGTILFRAKSTVQGVPDINVRFIIRPIPIED